MIANIGGIFIYSATPAALAEWHKEHLGIQWEHNPEYKAWYASFEYTEIETGKKRSTAWSILPNDTRPKFQGKVFCVNYRTNHMDTLVAHLRSKGVEVKGPEDSPPQGRFAWCEDPTETISNFGRNRSYLVKTLHATSLFVNPKSDFILVS